MLVSNAVSHGVIEALATAKYCGDLWGGGSSHCRKDSFACYCRSHDFLVSTVHLLRNPFDSNYSRCYQKNFRNQHLDLGSLSHSSWHISQIMRYMIKWDLSLDTVCVFCVIGDKQILCSCNCTWSIRPEDIFPQAARCICVLYVKEHLYGFYSKESSDLSLSHKGMIDADLLAE